MTPPIYPAQAYAHGLWNRAFDSLSNDLKSSLNQAATHKRDILAAVLKVAEDKREISLRRRWKFKGRNNETVVIRDVLEKIAKWVDCFKAIGDVAVQFDASAASLPWAAMRFLLQITVNDVQQFGTMVQDIEIVSRIIARYKEFELLHLSRKSPVQSALENALTGLYTEVLTHLARIIDFFSKSTPVRLAKGLVRMGDEDYVQRILTQEDEVLKLAKLQDTEILRFLETAVLRLRDQSNMNTRLLDEESHTKMVSWLSTSPFPVHHETISQSRTPNFGQWLLTHENYQYWCQTSSSSALWLHGIIGSGKTHLFSVVVDSLLATAALNKDSTPFAYFYCLKTDTEPERSSADEILRSILRQLAVTEAQANVHALLYSEFERRSKSERYRRLEIPRLTRKECVDFIVEVANDDPVTILLDGVDQIEEHDRFTLLDALDRVISEAANVVKVFLTSRNDNEMPSSFPATRKITITRQNTHSDMVDFIFQGIDDARLLGGKMSPEMRTSLANMLLNGADEMFLWTRRQIQQLRLRKIKLEEDLLPALETNILHDLDTLYEESLSQIFDAGNSSRQFAIHIFSWLLYMKGPLTPSALLAAITTASTGPVPISPGDISDLCSNLVIVDIDREVIRFAHQSIQEYLLRTKQDLFSPSISHTLLASTCIKISSHGPPNEEALASQVKDFYFYAATYWATHFRSAKAEQNDDIFQEMVSFVFEEEDWETSLSFEAWLDICTDIVSLLPNHHLMKRALDAIPNELSSPLFLAAVFGLDGLITLLATSDRGTDWNQKNTLGHTAIYLAAALGHVSTVSLLMHHGAELDVECGRYGSPIKAACFGGHAEVVEKLLQNDASTVCGFTFKNALDAAFHGRHEHIVLDLIRHGSSIKSETDYEQVVQMAAEYGFIQVMDELQKPAFISFRQEDGPSKQKARMAKAIKGGQLGVLKQHLRNKLNPSEVLPESAIAIAALYGHNDLVQFLLSKDMSVEAEGQFGSPLRSASLMNRKSTIQLLLQSGADVKTGERRGNALYVAAVKGHNDIAKILIQEGADVNQATGSFGSILHAAAYFGHRNMVEILLDAGADVHVKGCSEDAFHAAAEGGHHDIIVLFLERGYSFHRSPPQPMYASGPRSSKYRQLVRQSSFEQEESPRSMSRGKSFTIPQQLLVERQYDEDGLIETEICLFETSDLSLRTNSYIERNPRLRGLQNYQLEASAEAGREEVVKILLDQQRTLGIFDDAVTRAMEGSVRNGHLGIVKLFIESVAKRKPIQDYISMILKTANIRSSHIVEYALDKASTSGLTEDEIDQLRLDMQPGPEKYKATSVDDYLLRSDFISCCTHGDQEALSSILECKHKALLQTNDVTKGLERAAERGHESVLKLLLDHRPFQQTLMISDDALVFAASSGFAVFNILIQRTEDLSERSGVLSRAIFAACHEGHPKVLEYLIEGLGVGIPELVLAEQSEIQRHHREPKQKHLVSPLQVALRGFEKTSVWKTPLLIGDEECSRRQKVVELLLKHGADPNSLGGQNEYPIRVAVGLCPEFVVKVLIEAGADATLVHDGDSALTTAVERELESSAITRTLLEAGVIFPEIQDERVKLMARVLKFFEGDTERYDYKDAGRDPDGRFLHAPSLKYVFDEGPGAVLETLIRHYRGEELSDKRYSLVLQMCCLLGKKEFVELLLARGVDVNGTGYFYGCPIQAAARSGQVDIVKVLLEAGANVNTLQGRWHTPLRAAIVGGHGKIVQLLVEHGARVDLKYKTERPYYNEAPSSTLQLAIQHGSADIVKTLLMADPASIEDGGYMSHPLTLSCQQERLDITKLLLEANATINLSGRQRPHESKIQGEDASPLHAAVARGHAPLVELLLLRGADVNLEVGGLTPLLTAAEKSDLHIVRLLLNAGADVNHFSDSATALSQAVRRGGNITVVTELIRAGATVTGPSPHPNCLKEACYGGQYDIIEHVLETLCSSNNNAEALIDEALEAVARRKHPQNRIMSLLLDFVPPTPKRFLRVCSSGAVQPVAHMLKQGINIHGDDGGNEPPPLHITAHQLRSEVVKLLIEQGADVNYEGWQHVKPLTVALESCAAPLLSSLSPRPKSVGVRAAQFAAYNHSDSSTLKGRKVRRCERIVELLLDNGAVAGPDDCDFGHPLHLACLIGSTAMVTLFIKNGSGVNSVGGGYFDTPLFTALRKDNLEVVTLLLDNGADVNYVHQDHGTPLHFACGGRNQTMVSMLLQYGASVTVQNRNGETAFTVALKAMSHGFDGDWSVFRIIEQASRGITVSENDILLASKISSSDHVLVALLSANKDLVISEDLIVRFLEEKDRPDEENLKLLFQHSGGLGITKRVLLTAPQARTVEQMLQHSRLSCKITPEILENQTDVDSMKLLLGYYEDSSITEGVVIRALQDDGRHDRSETTFLDALWKHDPLLVVTNSMLTAAKSVTSLEFLLQRLGPAPGTLQDVADFISEKDPPYYESQAKMLSCLIPYDSEMKLTVRMIEHVMRTGGPGPLEDFLTHESTLPITEKLFMTIFGQGLPAKENARSEFAEILHRQGKKMIFTDKIRDAIDRTYQKQTDMQRKWRYYSLRERDETTEEAESRKGDIGDESNTTEGNGRDWELQVSTLRDRHVYYGSSFFQDGDSSGYASSISD
ncbi:hypothetical protein G7Z17_g1205 [Cylindrodendrum hubeiense]|uniref:Uncharacterized protein n=1 Tax=Cylindrodendrum hubeiense TaxID=595255 RepID=A0A9P5LFI0_9HYPO|nr:hypothetical protein G7Z17_g1205 [Cylindrodendrum hubeiense]